MRDPKAGEKFEAALQEYVDKTNGIECPPDEYRSHLRAAIDELGIMVEASEATG